MQQEPEINTYDGVIVPAPVPVKLVRKNKYGHVPGLPDSELADPAELERWVMIQEWGPILALPKPQPNGFIRPEVDEFGDLDWGAFGTVDFDRARPRFNAARYKADKLKEELRNTMIMFGIIQGRLSAESRLEVVERIRGGEELDAFIDENEWAYAKWYLRARGIRRQICELRGRNWNQQDSDRSGEV